VFKIVGFYCNKQSNVESNKHTMIIAAVGIVLDTGMYVILPELHVVAATDINNQYYEINKII
jgi:hypothetical protein